MELQGGYFRLFWAILGLFWAPGSPSNHLILQPAVGDRGALERDLGGPRRTQEEHRRALEDPGGGQEDPEGVEEDPEQAQGDPEKA